MVSEQFYHPTSRPVLPSQDITFDKSVPFYRLFPYRSATLPPPPLFLAPGPPPVDPLPPQGPAPLDSGAARGAASEGAELRGAETAGAELGGAESEGAGFGGAEPGGAEPGGAELEGAEPGGAESEGAESGSAEPGGTYGAAGAGGSAAGGTGALGPGGTRAAGVGGAAGVGAGGTGAGAAGGTGATGLGGAPTGGTRAVGAGGATGVGAGDPGAGADGGVGAGGTGAGDTRAGSVGPRGAGVVGAGFGDIGRPRPYFVPLLQQVLGLPSSTGLTPPLLCPPPDQTHPPLQPASPLPPPSPYTEQTGGFIKHRDRVSLPALPVRAVCTGRCVPRPRPPPVLGMHHMALRTSSVPQRVPLPFPPASSLADGPDPESDLVHAASPTVPCLLATVVTDPSFECAAASALVAELVDFAAVCHLDYAASLVAESKSDCPTSVGGECALGTDVLEDRQEDFECFAADLPHLVSMLIAPEGDPDAPDIPTPRSYVEAITCTYVDAVPPPGANIVDGMWIFRVKRPPGSPPAFKARYVVRGCSQQQRVDFLQTFSHTPKMTTVRVLLHVDAQRDYELHFPEFSTAFLQGSLHEEIWLRRPLGFTRSFPVDTKWSLRQPLYGLRQAPHKWHDTLRTTLAALGFAPSTADPSMFLRADTSLPPFYVLVYVDDLVFATADTEALALVNSSCEAEIYARAMAAQELRWLTYLLTDLGERPCSSPVLYVDNKAMIALCQEHRLEHRTKHIALRYFLARELRQHGQLRLPYVATWANTADVFTKAFQSGDHQRFCTVLGLGSLHEEIRLRRPPGFTSSFPAGTQWSLRRPVYGLRQAPREWHNTLRMTLAALGFAPSTADPSLFLRTDTSLLPFYVLVYVDDLVFATADTEALALVKSELQKRHTCTDLGELRSYLGLQITRDRARRTITLTQSHMVHQVLQRFGFQFSSPQPTPLSTDHLLSALPSDESVEPIRPYPELVGCLMYLMTCTRPDLVYPLSLLARYVAPGRHQKVDLDGAKRVLRYLCSTSSMGLVLGGRGPVVLNGHGDASWVDDSAMQRTSQGYTFSLCSGSISWRSTRLPSVLNSSCEAEIYAGAMAAQELHWLTYLLTDLGEQPRSPPVLYVDNKAMIALCQEHRLEHRTKHIALRYFLARELQQRGQLRLAYVATRADIADTFTKALLPGDHQRFSTV
ncbi:unnamed protein product [Closterium sp. NIES-53]